MISPLNYTITPGRLGISINQPQSTISQRPADLSIQQPKADLFIRTTPGELRIDQTEAFAAMDRKGALRRADDFVTETLAKFPDQVKKRAMEGDQLMRIENGGNAIAQLAKRNGMRQPKQLALGFIPNSTGDVKIQYTPGTIDIQTERNEPVIHSTAHKPDISIPRWSVDIYLDQKPSLEIDYIGAQIDTIG